MKKIFFTVTTLFGFFSFIPDIFSQGGGGSTPDTALSNAVYFVHVTRRPPPPSPTATNTRVTANLETYMAIITGLDSNDSRPIGSHITFYKISCSTCNILRWTPPRTEVASDPSFPLRYTSRRVVSTVTGSGEPVTDPELKRQLLKALMVQTASASRVLQMEMAR
jgi:hypothetical protein